MLHIMLRVEGDPRLMRESRCCKVNVLCMRSGLVEMPLNLRQVQHDHHHPKMVAEWSGSRRDVEKCAGLNAGSAHALAMTAVRDGDEICSRMMT